MNWAISLIISENEIVERRLEAIILYVIKKDQIKGFYINDIDATGNIGNEMTMKMNVQKEGLSITEKEVITLVSEMGQIFELDLLLVNSFEYRFIIRDGNSLDIVSNGERLPFSILGPHNDLDVNLFYNNVK